MTYRLEERSGVVVVTLRGRLDGGPEAGQLFDALRVQCAGGRARFVVDLGDVTRVDPRGVGILASGLALARNHGGTLALARVPDAVRSLLFIARLLPAFPCHDAVVDAVDAVGA